MKERKILFVYYNDLNGNSGGSKVSLQDYRGCQSYGRCDAFQTGKLLWEDTRDMMFISLSECREIVRIIRRYKYNLVFFDASLYGEAIDYIRENCPGVKTIVRCHNYERKYFEDQERLAGGEKLSVRAAACEGAALRQSDFRIFISSEDREALCHDYSISTENSRVIPVALMDEYRKSDASPERPYVLFFGSKFFSNVEAARFLAEEVAPKITKKIVIAGKGMDTALDREYENVETIGFVPSLNELLTGADAVISPTFTGSGSKVKIAEALMYGKYIIANRSSLAGYDISRMKASICETAEDFAAAINETEKAVRFCPENRGLFLRNHDLGSQDGLFSFLEDL